MLKIPERFRPSKEKWHGDPAHHGGRRDSPTTAKEVLRGSYAGCASPSGDENPHGSLEVGGLPEEDPYANG